MAQKHYNYTLNNPLGERKSQPLTGFKTGDDLNKYQRHPEPFRNTSNHDSISLRLEEIKKKYSNTIKPQKYQTNSQSPKQKLFNENREALSQVKPKGKYSNQSPQKSVTRTKIQVTSSKTPYGSLKHKSFTGINDMDLHKTPKRNQNFETEESYVDSERFMAEERTGAIQKINSKIKSILDGINMGRRQSNTNTIEAREISLKASPQNQTRISKRGEGSPQMIKDIARQTAYSHSSIKPHHRHSYERNTYDIQARKQRSTSAIRGDIGEKTSLKASSIQAQEKKKLTGKELDDEIFKIQQRIKKSSDERQRLTQMLDKKQKRETIEENRERESGADRKNVEIEKRFDYVQKSEKRINSKFGKFEQKIYSIINNNPSAPNSNEKNTNNPYYAKSQKDNVYDSKSKTHTISEASQFSLKLHPIPCDRQSEQETRRLAMSLSDQVKVDEQLRNSRIWLQHLNDPSKWAKLTEHLSKAYSKQFSQGQIRQIFKHTQQQHNPFFSAAPNQSIQGVVQKYVRAQQHWNVKIVNKYNSRKLQEQGFTQQTLDLECKGYIQAEDVVRFLNIETGSFYRTRDVILIFKRLSKGGPRLNFDSFIKTIAKGGY